MIHTRRMPEAFNQQVCVCVCGPLASPPCPRGCRRHLALPRLLSVTARTPSQGLMLADLDVGLMHFQFADWPNFLLKQVRLPALRAPAAAPPSAHRRASGGLRVRDRRTRADAAVCQAWYKCLERVETPGKPPSDINTLYSGSLDTVPPPPAPSPHPPAAPTSCRRMSARRRVSARHATGGRARGGGASRVVRTVRGFLPPRGPAGRRRLARRHDRRCACPLLAWGPRGGRFVRSPRGGRFVRSPREARAWPMTSGRPPHFRAREQAGWPSGARTTSRRSPPPRPLPTVAPTRVPTVHSLPPSLPSRCARWS